MTLATETWAAASRWCSPRIASSAVVCCARQVRVERRSRTAESRGPYSRTRCRSCTTNAVWKRPRQRWRHSLARRVDARHVGVGGAAGGRGAASISSASRRRFSISASLSMLGQAHSSPMVSGATVWNAVQEAHQLGAIEAAVAVADQLHRQRVDAGVARLLARGQLGQLPVVAAGQVLPDVPHLGGDQVEVVEEPLGGRR